MEHKKGHHIHRHTEKSQHHNKEHNHSTHIQEFRKRFFVSAFLTIPVLLLSEMIQKWFGFSIVIPYQNWVLLLLSSVIYFYGGSPFLKGLLREIKTKQPGMMTLIGTAISVAFFYSALTVITGFGREFFWELATLIDVMLLGHWIEAKSVLGASRALEELVKIMPTTAHLVKNGNIVEVPVSSLKKGDIVLVKPGEKIPSDGTVIDGESYVNESLLTGESKPVLKKTGSKVIGGSINEQGVLKVKIERTGEETYLSQVIKLVKQAQESKSKTQDLANRAAAYLFYVAMGTGIITYIFWLVKGNPDFALERAVTVLVIACPHALGLAVPLVVALSTSLTAKNGILIRDRRAFEQAKDLTAVIFDKTGTLTEGKFGVSDFIPFMDEKTVLKYAASIEKNSEHIIAKAIVEFAREKGINPIDVNSYRTIPGKGAYGIVENSEVFVGSPFMMKELGIDISDPQIASLQKEGKTVIFVVVDKRLAGVFALSDRVKKESFEAVKKLKEMGIKVFMLTGDSEEVAKAVSDTLEIDEYFAEVLPHEKAEKVKLLKEKGYRVAMVGDGINDAPALVTADVGIAIGAGTDVAIESADIILVKSNPADVPKIIKISKITYSKMVQNLWWAAGYNIFAIPLAAGVLYSYGIVIQPALGALLMSISTVIVALNSQTLRKEKI
ncbi:cadmium-translocating P-type ATPase [Persephonella atlantica]|uniref:Cadmium-translocating P-type ATPase n=1 Tax=Persephonella atlantica TaxID=2699429 RepID=A0ABS1GGS8_9AQUI|nr:heavy metal translocating P-type ATPase [Persephonella atlantica]MBK3332124.1 cadmium-translocating P-type ATPase [Persephonella atlantica]